MKTLLGLAFFFTVALAQCPSNPLAPGDHSFVVSYGRLDREYNVHVPTGIPTNQSVALLIAMHGYFTDSPAFHESYTGFSDYADAIKSFIPIYPAGWMTSWNAGECCGQAVARDVDDFGFIRFLVGEVAKQVCVNPARVYVTGMSNGCFMSQGLICKAADIIAASACHSGGEILTTNCDDDFQRFNKTVDVLEIHGTEDILVPYEGNGDFPSIPENFLAFAKRMGCTSGPRVTFQNSRNYCEEYYNCVGGKTVEQCTNQGGDHTWFNNEEEQFGHRCRGWRTAS